MGYFTAVLDPDADQPGRAGQPPPCPDRLPATPHGLARAGAALAMPSPPNSRTCRRRRWRTLAAQRPVAPGADAVAIAQDRVAREGALRAPAACPARRYAVIETPAQLAAVADDAAARHPEDRAPGLRRQGPGPRARRAPNWPRPGTACSSVPCVLEKMLPLAAECSVIVARGADGADGALPGAAQPAPRRHPGRDRGLRRKCARSRLPQPCAAATESIAEGLRLRGRAVRRILRAGRTARWSSTRWRRARTTAATTRMDACDVSQFDLQVRTLAGLPLVAPRQHSPAIMLNLLGDLWFDARATSAARRRAWAERAGAARHAPAPVRQARGAPRPQDGPPQHHRRQRRRGAQPRRCRRPRCWACARSERRSERPP